MTSWISSTAETVFHEVCAASTMSHRYAKLPSKPVIVVVPTSQQRDDVLIQWARYNGRGEPPMVMTMAGLYRAIAPQVLSKVPRILPDSSVDVLLQHAMDACDLPVGAVRLRASRIVRWAQELRSPSWLRDAAARHPSHRAARQLATAARIWETYEGLLGTRAADRGTYCRRVVDAVRAAAPRGLTTPTGDTYAACLVVDTHGVTGVDAQLLQALADHGWDVAVQFAPEVSSGENMLESRTERDIQWFVAQHWHLGAKRTADIPVGERCLVPCVSRSDEVRRAVAVCKEAARSGVDLSSIAICVPGDQRYIERLRQACIESGVPLQIANEQSLAHTHAASLLYACCRVITGSWQRADVERVLREPLVRDLVKNGPALLLIAREERIVGGNGVQEWMERIEQRHADMLAVAERSGDDSDHAFRNAQRYAYALRTITELRAVLDVQAEGVMDAERFTSILLSRIVPAIDLERRCVENEPAALGAVRDACSAYMALHRDHELPRASFATHLHQWWTIVRATEIATHSRARSGIRLVRPAELRGSTYDLVVCVGCLEGEFPRASMHQLDEDVVPGVQRYLAWESMADIVFAAAPGGSTLFMYPAIVDGAPALASTTLDVLSDTLATQSRWGSADPAVACVVHPRDLRIDATQVPPMDRSQLADVRVLAHEDAQHVLAEDLARPVSPSRLDLVLQCPYRFFAQSILRLDDLDIDDVRLTPLERGTLLHDVAHRWYRRMRNDVPVEITPAGLRTACIDLHATTFDHQWALLQRIVDEVLAEQSHVHLFAPVERRALIGDDRRAGLLKRWLALERDDQRASGFMPVLFEHEIDVDIEMLSADGSVSVPVKTRIDRIDLREVDGSFYVSVVDYKSSLSNSFTISNVAQGKASQMPIYLLAVQTWFAQQGVAVQPEAAVYRAFGTSLQSPANLERRVVLADQGSPMVRLGRTRAMSVHAPLPDVLTDITRSLYPGVSQLQSRTYPVRPLKTACDTCRVSSVCRKDHWGILTASSQKEEYNVEEGYDSSNA